MCARLEMPGPLYYWSETVDPLTLLALFTGTVAVQTINSSTIYSIERATRGIDRTLDSSGSVHTHAHSYVCHCAATPTQRIDTAVVVARSAALYLSLY